MRSAFLLAALAALLAGAPAQAATHRERVCAQRGITAASSASARVFEVDRGGDRTLYGCLRRGGRLRTLASWFSCDCSVGDETAPSAELIAGVFVELTHHPSCGPFDCEAGPSYALRNLRSGRTAAPVGPVSQIERGTGWFAYADERVVRVRSREETVLDPGPGVEPGSLAIAGRRLYWTARGLPFSSALP